MSSMMLLAIFGIGFVAILLWCFWLTARVAKKMHSVLAMISGACSLFFYELVWIYGFYWIFRERAIEVMAQYLSFFQEHFPMVSAVLQHKLQQ